jgi:hypothetical protein
MPRRRRDQALRRVTVETLTRGQLRKLGLCHTCRINPRLRSPARAVKSGVCSTCWARKTKSWNQRTAYRPHRPKCKACGKSIPRGKQKCRCTLRQLVIPKYSDRVRRRHRARVESNRVEAFTFRLSHPTRTPERLHKLQRAIVPKPKDAPMFWRLPPELRTKARHLLNRSLAKYRGRTIPPWRYAAMVSMAALNAVPGVHEKAFIIRRTRSAIRTKVRTELSRPPAPIKSPKSAQSKASRVNFLPTV